MFNATRTLKPGLYRNVKAIVNPKPDRRTTQNWTTVAEIPAGSCLFLAKENVSSRSLLQAYVEEGTLTQEQADERVTVEVTCRVLTKSGVQVIGSCAPLDRLRQAVGSKYTEKHELVFWANLVDALEPAEDSLEGFLFQKGIGSHGLKEIVQAMLDTKALRLTDLAKAWGRVEEQWDEED